MATRIVAPGGANTPTPGNQNSAPDLNAERMSAKYRDVVNLLYAAAKADEDGGDNGNSARLIRVAWQLAELEQALPDEHSEDRGYDIAALLSASRRVPGDQHHSKERHDLIEQAGKILGEIAGCADILRQDEAPASVGPKADGYTCEQYRAMLEVIAGRAATLNNVLMMAQSNSCDWESSVLADAAQAMCVAIGAMADVEGDVIGDAARWNFGPNFATAGRGDAT